MRRPLTSAGLIAFAIAMLVAIYVIGTYNNLVSLDQRVQAQWSQVQNVYQRRSDLVPNLVATVKGAAAFEKQTFTAVTEARAKATQASAAGSASVPNDPRAFARFEQTQNALTSALARMTVVVENYPDLKATANFRDLQAQLEGTENRIAVERMRFNETAQSFNTAIQSFPTNLVAAVFGARFHEKAYFKAQADADVAPRVQF